MTDTAYGLTFKFAVPTASWENVDVLNKTYSKQSSENSDSKEILKAVPFDGLERIIIWEMISNALKRNESKINGDGITLSFALYYVKVDDDRYLVCHDRVGNGDGVKIPASYYFGKIPLDTLLDAFSELHNPGSNDKESSFSNPKNWPHWAGLIMQTITLRKRKENYEFSGQQFLQRVITGEFSSFAPLPPFSFEDLNRPSAQEKLQGVVVSSWRNRDAETKTRATSGAIEENLLALTQALKFAKSQVALVIGAPGSGKDSFTKALHYGSVAGHLSYELKKRTPDKSPEWATSGLYMMSIAGISTEEFSSRLLTQREYQERVLEPDVISTLDGGGTIFIDEFDKPDSTRLGFYGFLLRILEAKEYVRTVDRPGELPKQVPARYAEINWVLAGAFSQSDPRKTIPRDLWSRLDTFVRLRNPIERDSSYVATLFLHAYFSALIKNLELSYDKVILMLKGKGNSPEFERGLLRRFLGYGPDDSLSEMEAFLPTPTLFKFSERFAEQVRAYATYEGDPIDTARSIIKASTSAFFALKKEALARASKEFPLCQSRGDQLPDAWEVALKQAIAVLEVSRGPG